uniref:Metallothionein n=1 Tax=Suricata suricatta TaxID=37032 RepID=A0A673U9F2_SURSU
IDPSCSCSPTGSCTCTTSCKCRVHMHPLQEELLLLLPCGRSQVCPGPHLQGRIRQVQLLCLIWGRVPSRWK